MRWHVRVLCFVAAASMAVGLVTAARGATRPGEHGTAVAAATSVSRLLAGPDAFRAALGNGADHLVSVAPADQAASARLLLLLATSLCALGLLERLRPGGRPPRSPNLPQRPRAHQGVGLRAPPSPVLA